MKKKFLCVMLISIMLASISGCQMKPETESAEPVVMFVSGKGFVEDGSFNSGIAQGLKKGAKELKYDLKILETKDDTEYMENLKAAIDAKPDMIVAGPDITDAMVAAASDNSEINFVAVDAIVDEDKVEQLPGNFKAMTFNNSEGAFLMGTLAASVNLEASVFGFIAGIDMPLCREAEIGYKAGVKAISPSARVLSSFIGDFDDAEKGAQIAAEQNAAGASVIFGFAGGANKGIIKNAAEKGYWSIGVDKDQALVYPSFASSILGSMVKNLDTSVYQVVKSQMDGNFKGGVELFGVGNGGITLGSGGGNITPELQVTYDEWQKAITSGDVKVPNTQTELDAFKNAGAE